MKVTERNSRILHNLVATLLALTLVASLPLACLADAETSNFTQQERIINHAMEHRSKTFLEIKDRNEGLKIRAGTPWCAWFIEHCAYECGLDSIIPTKSKSDLAVGNLAQDLVKNKKATITFVNKTVWNKLKDKFTKSRRKYNKNYKPQKGDIILYGNYQISGSYWFSHVGFVYENCDNALKGVKTIEGNTLATNEKKWEKTSIVGVRTRAGDTNKERRIVAYIRPKYCKHPDVDETTGKCLNNNCGYQVREIPLDDNNTGTITQ